MVIDQPIVQKPSTFQISPTQRVLDRSQIKKAVVASAAFAYCFGSPNFTIEMQSHTISSITFFFVWARLSLGLDPTLLDSHSPFLFSDGGSPVVEYFAPVDGKIQPVFQSLKSRREFRLIAYYDKQEAGALDLRETLLRTASALNELVARNNKSITTYAVSCGEFPGFCETQMVKSTPAYHLYKQGSSRSESVDQLDMETMCNLMGVPYDIEVADKWWSGTIGTSTADPEVQPVTRTMEELSSDIHLSFDSAMRHYVYDNDLDKISQPLNGEQRSTLKRWLMLIHKTTPSTWSVHLLVKQLINSFMYVSKNRAYLLSILDTFKPEASEYSPTCQGEHHHSFTCGVWEMFHAVSVGLVEFNKIGDDSSENIPSRTALSIMLKYIETFGMGDDLKVEHHFSHSVRKCLDDEECLAIPESKSKAELERSWIRFPLWISKIHNEVKKKANTIPVELVAGLGVVENEWPPRALCPKCWNKTTGNWNDDMVYKFLKKEYTIVERLTASLKKELLASRIDPPSSEPAPRTRVKAESRNETIPPSTRQRYIVYFVVALVAARLFMSRHSIKIVQKKRSGSLLPEYVASGKPAYQASPSRRSTWVGESRLSPLRTPSKKIPRTSHSYAGSVYSTPLRNRTPSSTGLPIVSSAIPRRSEHGPERENNPAALRRRSFTSSLSYGY